MILGFWCTLTSATGGRPGSNARGGRQPPNAGGESPVRIWRPENREPILRA